MQRLLWIGLIFALLIGCDARTSFDGQIVDSDGNPIEGARVTVILDGEPLGIGQQSVANGSFEAGGTHAPTKELLELTITKEGFKKHVQRVQQGSNHAMRIVMEREASKNEP